MGGDSPTDYIGYLTVVNLSIALPMKKKTASAIQISDAEFHGALHLALMFLVAIISLTDAVGKMSLLKKVAGLDN